MKKILKYLLPPRKWIPFTIIAAGIGTGLFVYLLYVSNAVSYLSDDPKTCVNCHVMTSFYATWQHSSHARVANCNDCHVPHNNPFNKYFFKAKDGIYHATVFTWRTEPQVIQIKEAGTDVVQKNCQRCHGDLNANISTTGVTLESKKHGEGKLCWDCHREVPHGRVNSLSSVPNARVPLLNSPLPEWLIKQTDSVKKSKKENIKIKK
ncbi:cytochrome c nitrite reductase small subunit [Flavobacterium ustbae]|uniref:cytochrome c nitrite reductase small subunit n=1 Tax=Flavobacterium ustbae TaxID=2488790 RepID=UPI000F789DFE|nr:cytochrome c nitrite reductase small subunit [Flavobacterium ustbae]